MVILSCPLAQLLGWTSALDAAKTQYCLLLCIEIGPFLQLHLLKFLLRAFKNRNKVESSLFNGLSRICLPKTHADFKADV